MPALTVESRPTNPIIRLESAALAVTITPGKGGDITSIVHRPTGQETLWHTPWGGRPSGYALPGSNSAEAWMQAFPGGWQIMVPNASAESTYKGVRHSFHGEASLAPWWWDQPHPHNDDHLHMWLDFYTLPLTMERWLRIEGEDVLVIEEWLTNTSSQEVELIWGHHPGFGGALLDGPARLTCGARRITVDDLLDERGNALLPGHESDWPLSIGRDGAEVDLRAPIDGDHTMAYLHDFTEGWAALTRADGAIGVALSWDRDLFPTAWLWQELGGSQGAPWFGRGRVVGIEPCTTWPGRGLAAAVANDRPLLRLAPGERRETTLRLHVFTGIGEVAGVDAAGRAQG